MNSKKTTFNDLDQACKTLGLIGLENRTAVKRKYLELSKKHHPDMKNGETEKFQQINDAYKIVEQYMDQFCFSFTKEEFYQQNPHSLLDDAEWFKRKH